MNIFEKIELENLLKKTKLITKSYLASYSNLHYLFFNNHFRKHFKSVEISMICSLFFNEWYKLE